jgi:hypothetical protein
MLKVMVATTKERTSCINIGSLEVCELMIKTTLSLSHMKRTREFTIFKPQILTASTIGRSSLIAMFTFDQSSGKEPWIHLEPNMAAKPAPEASVKSRRTFDDTHLLGKQRRLPLNWSRKNFQA